MTDSDSASSAASKRKRGGQPGNLSKIANDPKGLALAFWRRGALALGSRWVGPLVKGYVERRSAELGELTEGQRVLVQTSALAQGVIALLISESAKRGGFVRDGESGLELTPAMRELPKFLARVHACETALGLERSKPVQVDAYALIEAQSQPVE